MNNNLGNITVSEDVINSIVTHVINEVQGLHTKTSITEKVLQKPLFVSSKIENDEVYITSNVEAEFGLELIPLVKSTQKKIKEEVEMITNLEVNEVNIKIVSII